MKWIDWKNILLRNRSLSLHFVVLDDNSFLQIFPDYSVPILHDLNSFVDRLKEKIKLVLYLTSPFLESFVHETICLKQKDLSIVDQTTLHFNKSLSKNRSVVSIATGQDRAITIHSHLSEGGNKLIESLRNQDCKIVWNPLLQLVINNFLFYQIATEEQTKIIQFLFQREVLQLDARIVHPKIHHVPFWNDHADSMKQANKARLLLDTSQENSTLLFNLIPQELRERLRQFPSEFQYFSKLIFPSSKKKKHKTVQYVSTRKSLKVTSNSLAKIFTCMIILLGVWAGIIYYEINELKVERSRLKLALQEFANQPSKLQQISRDQEQFFKINAIINATQSTLSNPNDLFNRIADLLPDGVWLENLSMDFNFIKLDVLDRQGTELSTLIELFNTNIGNTNIDHNESVEIGSYSLRKYGLTIQRTIQKNRDDQTIQK